LPTASRAPLRLFDRRECLAEHALLWFVAMGSRSLESGSGLLEAHGIAGAGSPTVRQGIKPNAPYKGSEVALLWRPQLAGEPTFSRLHWIDWKWTLLGSSALALRAFVVPGFRLPAIGEYSGKRHGDTAALANRTQRTRKQHGSAPKGTRSVCDAPATWPPPRNIDTSLRLVCSLDDSSAQYL
jgi:hypothetical protein